MSAPLSAAFSSVEEALAGMPAPAPDVALLDVHLPGMRGSVGVERFRERFPNLQVLGGCCGTDARHVAAMWGVASA